MSRAAKSEKLNELEKTTADRDKLLGISEFLTSPAYINVIAPGLKHWLTEAETTFEKLASTQEELKAAQLKMYYIKQIQRLMLNTVTDYERHSAKLLELTGEYK